MRMRPTRARRDPCRVQGAVAAEGDHRARLQRLAGLDRVHTPGAGYVFIDDFADGEARGRCIELKRMPNLAKQELIRCIAIDLKPSFGKSRGLDKSKRDVRICYGRICAALTECRRTEVGTHSSDGERVRRNVRESGSTPGRRCR